MLERFFFSMLLVTAPSVSFAQPAEPAPRSGALTNASVPNLTVSRDEGPSGHFERAVLQDGRNRFSFVVPPMFEAGFDPAGHQVRLVSATLRGLITFSVQPTVDRSGAAPTFESLEALARSTHPDVCIVDRFEVSVAGWRGVAIESTYTPAPGVTSVLRIAHVPFPEGILAFTVLASPERMRACDQPLNQLLLSIRAGLRGAPPEIQQFLPGL